MTNHEISRRQLAKYGLGLAAAAGFTSVPALHLVPAARARELSGAESPFSDESSFTDSLNKAYSFLNTMMDAYAQGTVVRLSQSYTDQQGLQTTGFVYDNSLAINAHLLRGRPDDIARAIVLGKALLHAQQVDSIGDGRVRQAYFVDQPDAQGAFVKPALFPFFFLGSAVGDMAWTGIGLAQLFHRTGDPQFLDGAVKLGRWIVNNTFDTRGAGGFNFGVDNNNTKLLFKSTEHNIDCVALFTMLAQFTGDGSWLVQAEHARTLVNAMFDSADGEFFFTGTTPDGVTVITDLQQANIPEDVQTWSFLATLDETHARSIDWAKTNLATTDTPQTINSRLTGDSRLSGVTFASQSLRALAPSDQFSAVPDPNAVWMEGTGHLAAALLARRLPARRDLPGFHGDVDTARVLLDNISTAQETLAKGQTVGGKAIPDGEGVVAASSVLNTGFGFSYNPNRHIGATSWFVMAGQAGNPFQPGLRTDRHDQE
ncbi:MAG TPA: Tat pathway signal sequence domain protein [Candidatus Angelobacter sp.]|nr:Tat pathway signal sequence domain protein [Candidatus Angelobacter sp.]